MIDWIGVFTNSLWILGASLALAVFSYASWEAQRQNSTLLSVLDRKNHQVWLATAGGLFLLGVAASMILSLIG
jgi:hypothetical protein